MTVSQPLEPRFGPYEVYERLGIGGMAMVHRAKKIGPAGFERQVALKRMLAHLAEDASFVDSFIREAKVASLLVHPNIAQIYDFGQIAQTYFIAMELVAGYDVRKLLRFASKAGEAIPLQVVLSIASEMCDALEFAHSFVDDHGQPLRIVHRDVSPSNLIAAYTGHVKVIDFGIAKANTRQLHTDSGKIKGKLGYMSPEAARGNWCGTESDVFSAGVVIWELIAAQPLFSQRTDFETMRRVREGEIVPPSRHNSSCPRELDDIVLASLARQPERRPTAGTMRAALGEFAARAGIAFSHHAVAEWMHRFAQPDDIRAQVSGNTAARSRATSSGPGFGHEVTVTSNLRGPKLVRSPEIERLATEIWGDAIAPTVAPSGALHNGPIVGAIVHTGGVPSIPSSAQVRFSPPTPLVRSGTSDPTPAPPIGLTPIQPRRNKGALIVLALLAAVVGVLAAFLVIKPSSSSAPPQGSAEATIGSSGSAGSAATPAVAMAKLEVTSDPPGLAIELDGVATGKVTPATLEVAAKTHRISVIRGHQRWTEELTAVAGRSHSLAAAFHGGEPTVVASTSTTAPKPDHQAAASQPGKPKEPKGSPKEPRRFEPRDAKPETKPEIKPETKPETKPEIQPETKPETQPEPETKPDTKPEPALKGPTRTPVVAATAVTKLAGELPAFHASGEPSGDVLAKMCIDEQGQVTQVKIVKSAPEFASDLQRALSSWRYKPYLKGDKASPACFLLSLRVVVKR